MIPAFLMHLWLMYMQAVMVSETLIGNIGTSRSQDCIVSRVYLFDLVIQLILGGYKRNSSLFALH
jgi:hypothetical protein